MTVHENDLISTENQRSRSCEENDPQRVRCILEIPKAAGRYLLLF